MTQLMVGMGYCLDCGFVGEPEQHTPGTRSWEVGLWLLSVVLGIIYSVWRRLARYQRCAKCGNKHIVRADSPVAQAALLRLAPTPSRKLGFCLECGESMLNSGAICERCEKVTYQNLCQGAK